MLKTSKKTRGFTLVELMVTLAVLAIIIGIAMPAMGQFTKKQAVRSTADELILSLVFARSEALKAGHDIHIMPVAAGWNVGWCATPDLTGCKDTSLLRSFSPSGKGLEITNSRSFNTGNPVTFTPRGMLKSGGTDAIFTVKDPLLSDAERRCITLVKTGRASVSGC